MTEEGIIKNRIDVVRSWFSNRLNLILVAILVLSLALRIYYVVQTSGQAMWYDEAEYMSTAKKWALGVPYELNPQRPPLFQAFQALGDGLFRVSYALGQLEHKVTLVDNIVVVDQVFDKCHWA